MPSAHSQHKGGCLRPPPQRWGRPLAAPPFVVSFVLAVSTGHILVLRCKTCALLRAKTSALLRRKTCAVLRARTYALLRANTKETTKGGGRRPPPLWVLVFVYFGLLGYISVLLGHLLTLLPYQLSGQIPYLRAFTHPGATFPVVQIHEAILRIQEALPRTQVSSSTPP